MRQALLDRVPSLKTLVLHHEDCLQHGGKTHQESAQRIVAIRGRLANAADIAPHEINVRTDFPLATKLSVVRAHSDKFVPSAVSAHSAGLLLQVHCWVRLAADG